MKAGYARVSTKDQAVDLQVDALKKAGCTNVYTEVMSGTRAERPILSKLLENLRTGDVLVIWKLDRLGRSLKHLIEVVNELVTRKIGLKSLNDPIDTTTPQGWRSVGHDAVFAFEGRGNLLEVVVGAIDGAEDKDGVVPSGKVPWRPS